MERTHWKYARSFMAFFCLLAICIGCFNFFMDANAVFNFSKQKDGFKARSGYAHVSVPYSMLFDSYDTLVVGSSRTYGVTCSDVVQVANDTGMRCNNVSTPHANASWIVKLVRHGMKLQPVRKVYFGLDFFGFNMSQRDFGPEDTDRLLGLPGKSDLTLVNDCLRQLFSLSVTMQSLRSARHVLADLLQSSTVSPGHAPSQSVAAPLEQNRQGPYIANDPFLGFYPGVLSYYDKYSLDRPNGGSVFRDLEALLAQCRQDGISVVFFINPFHSILLDVFNDHGLLPMFRQWKLRLIDTVNRANEGLSYPLFTLWDFSDYSDITACDVVKDGTVQRVVEYYEDPFHYKHNVGRLMLERMSSSSAARGDFGALLAPASTRDALIHVERSTTYDESRNKAYREFLFRQRKISPEQASRAGFP